MNEIDLHRYSLSRFTRSSMSIIVLNSVRMKPKYCSTLTNSCRELLKRFRYASSFVYEYPCLCTKSLTPDWVSDKGKDFCSSPSLNAKLPPFDWITEKEKKMFLTTFSDLVKEVKNNERYINNLELAERYVKLLEYNVPRGKLMSPLIMVAFYKLIEDPDKLSQENVQLSMVLAWCIQLLMTSFAISDDIIDSSETRRGIPCWYLVENVGIRAIKDTILLENGIHAILKRHLKNHHSYVPVIELFHEVSTAVTLGQSLDALSYKNGVMDFDTFNIDLYTLICKYKTSTLFVFPIRLATHFSSRCDYKLVKWAERFFHRIGLYFQVQNDFFDCFGDPLITGKNGTDIQEGKCSWLIVNAIQRASSKQKIILRQNYGKPNPRSIAAVRTIYEELDLPKLYASTEDDTYNTLQSDIQTIPQTSSSFFYQVLDRMYRRKGQTY